MKGLLNLNLLVLPFLFLFIQSHVSAIKTSYIVYFGAHTHDVLLSEVHLDEVAYSHHEFLGSYLGSVDEAKDAIFYSYTKSINGFAAMLEEDTVAEIKKHPKVVSIFPNRGRKLHTTHSWEFMDLENNGQVPSSSIWNKARYGEDIIIANLDSGVWPESKSFSDHGLGPVPEKWRGHCENDFPCNNKLIGARMFYKGREGTDGGKLNSTEKSPRDFIGHGSHTLSTAGGSMVPGANVFGNGKGTAKGGSPKARVASYKVCWTPIHGNVCFEADILAAYDAAIYDGVDVISVSLGGKAGAYFEDGIAIGAFHAVQRGITVICSAGNDGPDEGTVSNIAPWIITVGASTMDRDFHTFVHLKNGLVLKGTSLSKSLPTTKLYPLLTGEQGKAANAHVVNATLCEEGALDPNKVKGKILVCLRGDIARLDKGEYARRAGAVGMILCNDESTGDEIVADMHFLPSSQLTYKDSQALFAYINSSSHPSGTIYPTITKFDVKPAPQMAVFSSMGPNTITPEILKPDITAPGDMVIAAYSEVAGPTPLAYDHRSTAYNILSGTSMSCPHVAGVVGLLKKLQPEWSPAAIRSAIMTSSRTRDNTVNPMQDSVFAKATPFNYGAGHIRPNRAMNPGLIYDLTVKDYLTFLCASGYNATMLEPFSDGKFKCPKSASVLDLNYPSVSVPFLSGTMTVTRRVKNVGKPGTYAARLIEPVGIRVAIEPKVMKFKEYGEEKTFKLSFTAKNATLGDADYVFGGLTWTDGEHYVRSPIVVAQKY